VTLGKSGETVAGVELACFPDADGRDRISTRSREGRGDVIHKKYEAVNNVFYSVNCFFYLISVMG